MINADLHTHICKTDIEEMVVGAQENNIVTYGVSGHAYQFEEVRKIFPDFYLEGTVCTIEEYLNIFKNKYNNLTLLCGVEMDFISYFTTKAEQALKDIEFDYVIGSLHEIDGWDIHHAREFTEQEAIQMWERNIDIQIEWMQQGRYNILGHAIRMVVTTKWNVSNLEELLDRLVTCAKAHQVAIELNARDYRTDRQLFELLLRICKKKEADITIGSDAHYPEHVANQFQQIEQSIRNIGYSEYCIFKNGKKIKKSLE